MRSKLLNIYYLLLLVLLMTWNSQNLPPMNLRLFYLCLVALPITLKDISLFPAVFTTFVLISANRSVPSYMPFKPEFLVATATVSFVLSGIVRKTKFSSPPLVLILLMLFVSYVNISKSYSIETLSFSIILIILFFIFQNRDVEESLIGLSISLTIVSFVLCLEFIVLGDNYIRILTIGYIDFERIGWCDPNYLSALMGTGALSALTLLITKPKLKRFIRFYLILTIILVIVICLKMASRGAITALFLSFIIILFPAVSGKKITMKIVLPFIIFIFVLYCIGGFDFIYARFTNDAGDYGGRRIIWEAKWHDFVAQATTYDWMFGIGHEDGYSLSSYVGLGDVIGFHNDFISFLICYGVIGLLLLIIMFLQPIIKYKDYRVFAGIVYMMTISLSIEPLSSSMDFYYYYFYIMILGRFIEEKESKHIF